MTDTPAKGMMKVLNDTTAQQWKWTVSNPLANLSPTALVSALTTRDQGWLREFALLYLKLEETDTLLAGLCPKRRSATARLPWEIVINDGFEDDPQAQAQKDALNYLYTHLIHRDALDLDHEGGVGALVEHVMLAQFLGHDVHELVWKPEGADLTVECTHAHLAMFESTTGRLRYTGPLNRLGDKPLLRGEWLVAKGTPLGIALAIAAMYKNLTWKDWLAFNELCGLHSIHGKTSAGYKTEQWNDFAAALAAYGSNFAFLTGPDGEVNFPSANVTGNQSFQPLFDVLERAQARLVMGSDLSTLSRREGTGASLQADDQHMLLEDDARRVSETLNTWIDQPALSYLFGPGTQPLVSFRLTPPTQTDDIRELDKLKALQGLGVSLAPANLADRFGIAADDLTQPVTTPKGEAASNSEPVSNSIADMQAEARQAVRDDCEAVITALREALGESDAHLFAALSSIDRTAVTEAALNGTAVASAIIAALGKAFTGQLNVEAITDTVLTERIAQA